MNVSLTIVGLALIWAAITGNFSLPNIALGAGVGLLTAVLLRNGLAKPLKAGRLRRVAALAALFLWELLVSAVRVALIVLRPSLRASLRPAIIAFPLTVKSDVEITLLANLITLTPGTLSVDIADDRSALYVHVLHLTDRDQLVAEIAGGFERRVREVFE
ncbi:Na+/H+ antiporter subunit E [Devosia sp. SL43]|uniref:Na+/H+ antiporter subunit E n=1 Tax=Devosia sp. SL43 TaxID=2806348 RepID=UPI001F15D3DC|nr:Na+/H+ antiporter subunit E [Devosia sp. SL43]UJW85489.1 Na+/H+ antiporter subunit E [Devosia sp. SL43]